MFCKATLLETTKTSIKQVVLTKEGVKKCRDKEYLVLDAGKGQGHDNTVLHFVTPEDMIKHLLQSPWRSLYSLPSYGERPRNPTKEEKFVKKKQTFRAEGICVSKTGNGRMYYYSVFYKKKRRKCFT